MAVSRVGGGTDPVGDVWYTGTVDTSVECSTKDGRSLSLSPTENANTEALWLAPNDYDVSVNGTPLGLIVNYDYAKVWADGESYESYQPPAFMITNSDDEVLSVSAGAPCDWANGTSVEVTVAHK